MCIVSDRLELLINSGLIYTLVKITMTFDNVNDAKRLHEVTRTSGVCGT